ncbi:N-acetylgalactosaminoglycan deacetylase, partial [Cutibacterium acnes FZ1/2/0]
HGSAANKAKHISCDWDWAMAQSRAILGSNYFSSAFRYPGGHMSWTNLSQADATLAKRGVGWIDWNAMSGDADAQRPTTVPGYLQMVKKSIKESNNPNVVVILNHDTYGKQMTAKAMPSILAWLKSQGYEFGVIA